MRQGVLGLVLVCFCAFAGGLCSPLLWGEPGIVPRAQAAEGQRSVFSDDNGKVRLDLGVVDGQPLADMWGDDGKLRLQLGTYSGSVVASEKGLPVMTFYDNQGRLKMLLRLASGANQSPVLVMKDNSQHDRIVMGLSLNGADEAPFLVYYDQDGTKHAVFGSF